MKPNSAIALLTLCALSTSCSQLDILSPETNISDRQNEYTQKWIETFGLFDPNHDWTTLHVVSVDISAELGADAQTRIYNCAPSLGGHLIGVASAPGHMTLDLPKNAVSVYAEVIGNEGKPIVSGEYDVTDKSISIGSNPARQPDASRSAHDVPYFDAMVVCEDLGGIGDYDFNDVVLGLRYTAGTTTLKIRPMAAGGTIATELYYVDQYLGEIHELLAPGSQVSDMINTTAYEKVGDFIYVNVPGNFNITTGWKNLKLRVKDKDTTIEIHGPQNTGEAPQMFCLGGDWFWPTEKTRIEESYPGFTEWAADALLTADWAYAPQKESLVVPWEIAQTNNWFSGTTTGGSSYQATLDGTIKVNVASGEQYFTDPAISTSGMFKGCSTLKSLDLSHFDTSKVDNMTGMFVSCTNLTNINLKNFCTDKVTTMAQMFGACYALTELDVSGFNTSEVTDMSSMFGGCSTITDFDLKNFNTEKVTTMAMMFGGCWGVINIDVTSFNTGEVTDMSSMFGGCGALSSIDVSGFNTSKVTNMASMFNACYALHNLDVSNFNTGAVTSMSGMFSGCTGIRELNLSNMDVSNVTNMYNMFWNCSNLETLDLTGWVLNPSISSEQTHNNEEIFSYCNPDLKIKCSAALRDIFIAHAAHIGLPTALRSKTSSNWIIVD